MHQMKFEVAGGLQVAADVMGPIDAPPVLLLHGGGQTRSSWKNSVDMVAALGYRCYSLDARGHGESDSDPRGDYTPSAFAGDLREIILRIGRPVVLIGASLGGVTSLLVAGEGGPPLAKALVLVDVTTRTNPYGVARIHAFMSANPNGFTSIEEAADAVAAYAPHRPRTSNSAGLAKNLRKIGDRFYWHWDPRFLGSWEVGHRQAGPRLEAATRALTIPILIVHAAKSDVIGPDEIEHFRSLAPQAEYVCVENAGHMVVGDDNNSFNRAITSFLERHLPLDGKA